MDFEKRLIEFQRHSKIKFEVNFLDKKSKQI